MLTPDPIDILIASDAWGTRTILTICATLPPEQFHRKFPIGLGSLHDTIAHVISAARRWTDRLADRPLRPSLITPPSAPQLKGDDVPLTPQQLLVHIDDAERDLKQTMDRIKRENRLGSTLTLEWPAGPDQPNVTKIYTFTRACIIAHITTHGYHHRAQCLNMLRQLGAPVPGVTPGLPEPSAVDWQVAHESPPVIKG